MASDTSNIDSNPNPSNLPLFLYKAVDPSDAHEHLVEETAAVLPKLLDGGLDLGEYRRFDVSNLDPPAKDLDTSSEEKETSNGDNTKVAENVTPDMGRQYFDLGLRLMMSYQHELAAQVFLACLAYAEHCALAHGLVALCHSPNYNFKGESYYQSTHRAEEVDKPDLLCLFPSQQVADRHSKLAIDKIEELRRLHRSNNKKKKKTKNSGNNKKGKKPKPASTDEPQQEASSTQPQMIAGWEVQWLTAIRALTSSPGVAPELSHDLVGRPYADAMRNVYEKHQNDPDIAYAFCESLMVLNAWQLYEYPSGKPVSPDVEETRRVLERSLEQHPTHAGLCHMYVHLSEMSAHPEQALAACKPLRTKFAHAGHLVHMATHIDVLLGNYSNCVRDNRRAIAADRHIMACSPCTAGPVSFYFGYIVHDYHMAVYGAILGAMESEARSLAAELEGFVTESLFEEYPELVGYLESYSALDVHVLVRFGRWDELLALGLPKSPSLMLYRSSVLRYGRALAYAAQGDLESARHEANVLDSLRGGPEAEQRILHNNSIAQLLHVDAVMLRGEIMYREAWEDKDEDKFEKSFTLLRQAVQMQDDLNYDEPWGKMQPIRHALGGLLLEQGQVEEATVVFRRDLVYHPRNPWALVGLVACLEHSSGCCGKRNDGDVNSELATLREQLLACRSASDFDVQVACECCQRSP